jgi:hypothetical protein
MFGHHLAPGGDPARPVGQVSMPEDGLAIRKPARKQKSGTELMPLRDAA